MIDRRKESKMPEISILERARRAALKWFAGSGEPSQVDALARRIAAEFADLETVPLPTVERAEVRERKIAEALHVIHEAERVVGIIKAAMPPSSCPSEGRLAAALETIGAHEARISRTERELDTESGIRRRDDRRLAGRIDGAEIALAKLDSATIERKAVARALREVQAKGYKWWLLEERADAIERGED